MNSSFEQDILYAACVTIHLVKLHVTNELQAYYGHPEIRHSPYFKLVQTVTKSVSNSPGETFHIISHLWSGNGFELVIKITCSVQNAVQYIFVVLSILVSYTAHASPHDLNIQAISITHRLQIFRDTFYRLLSLCSQHFLHQLRCLPPDRDCNNKHCYLLFLLCFTNFDEYYCCYVTNYYYKAEIKHLICA